MVDLQNSDAGIVNLWNHRLGNRIAKYGGGTGYSSYVIIGKTMSYGDGQDDAWLIKTDTNGNKLWDKTFGGAGVDFGRYGQQTLDGGFIVIGYTTSIGSGGGDIWLIKTDLQGNEEWNRTFGGVDWERGLSIMQTNDGGFIIAGYTATYGNGNYDVWLIKTNSAGTLEWSKTFGGTNNDEGYSVQQTLDGGFIVTGYTTSFGNGSEDVWLIKTDSQGNEKWNQTFGGSGKDNGNSVQDIDNEGYIIAGWTESFGNGGRDAWLIRTDSEGHTDPFGN